MFCAKNTKGNFVTLVSEDYLRYAKHHPRVGVLFEAVTIANSIGFMPVCPGRSFAITNVASSQMSGFATKKYNQTKIGTITFA